MKLLRFSTADFNGDGRSDIYLKLKGKNAANNDTYVSIPILSKGYNYFTATALADCNKNFNSGSARFADFNGDGKLEVGNNKGELMHWSSGHYRKMSQMGDGYGNVSYIDYKKYSDIRVFEKTNTNYGNNTYQIQPAGYLAAQLRLPNGIGGHNSTQYKFEGLHVHSKGKGGLGFEKVTVTDLANKVKNVNESEFYSGSISLRPKRESKYLLNDDGTEEELSRKSYAQYTNYSTNYAGRKVFYQFPKETVTSDFLTGGAVIQRFTYPDNQTGNITTQIVERYNKVNYHSNGDFNNAYSTQLVEKVTESYQYGLFGSIIPSSLTKKTVTTYYKGGVGNDANATVVTDYDYYSNGLMKWEKHFANVPAMSFVNHFEYFTAVGKEGLLRRKYTRKYASSVDYNIENYDYDNQKRLTTTQNQLGYVKTNVYDLNGARVNQISEKIDFDNLSDIYEYDGLGRLIKTTSPQVGWYKTEAVWIPGGDATKRYKIVTSGQFKPTSEVYYDDLGRETKTKTALLDKIDATNGFSYTEKEYNARGSVIKETLPYKTTQSILKKYNFPFYDKYNRTIHIKGYSNTPTSGAGLDTYFQYAKASNYRTERIVKPDGRYKTKKYDFSGKLMSVVDDETTIEHQYYISTGKLYKTYLHGNKLQQQFSYDIQGHTIHRVDNSFGNETFVYDALGRLMSKTNSNGTTSFTYDELHRLETELNNEGLITAIYNNVLGSNGIGNVVSKVKTKSGSVIHSLSYTYDMYSNQESVTEILEGETSVTDYEYLNGKLYKKTFGDGIGYEYTYDPVSQMISKVRYTTTDLTGYIDLYEPKEYNAKGKVLRYTRFANIETTKKYAQYVLETESKTGSVHHYEYKYDRDSQNLLSKFNVLSGKGEKFTYTDRDQLATSTVYSWQDGPGGIGSPYWMVMYSESEESPKSIAYDTDHYANIVSKTDIGTYAYGGSNPHQLSSVTQPSGTDPMNKLKVHHMTSSINDKPLTLKSSLDNTASTNAYYKFKLGLGDHRISNKKYSNYVSPSNLGSLEETRLYFNGYEKLTKGSDVYKIHYIGFGEGTEFVFKKKNTQSWVGYVAHTDYQGTIVKLTDVFGYKKFEQNFDAWGRRRYHNVWTLDGSSTPLEDVTVGDATTGEDDNSGGSNKLAEQDSSDDLLAVDLANISVMDQDYYAPAMGLESNTQNNPNPAPIPSLAFSSSSTSMNFDNHYVEEWFNRGYTGHEHLEGADIIHMNARLYDPYVGRFLSGDKEIAEPDNADNYNRYAYALNNPTKYTDPSGNSVLGAIIVGSIIAAAFYTYGVAASAGSFANWSWGDFTTSVAFGAIGGAVTSGIGAYVAEHSIGFIGQALMHGGAAVALTSAQTLVSGQSLKFSNVVRSFITSVGSSAMSSLAGVYADVKDFTTVQTQRLMLGVASLTGGLTQALTGGKFMRGAATGFAIALLNHIAHAVDDKEGTSNNENRLKGVKNGEMDSEGNIYFDNLEDAYDYLWANSFDENGEPVTEMGGWILKEGRGVIIPHQPCNELHKTELLRFEIKAGGFAAKFNGKFYKISSQIHTHPTYMEGNKSRGYSDEDDLVRKTLSKGVMTILYNSKAYIFNGAYNHKDNYWKSYETSW